MTRSRRAGLSRDEARQQPLYARMLGLQYLAPGGFLCFVFLEGAVALGILLALAELVSWWGVLALPLTVAAMVKLNDVVAGALIRPATIRPPVAVVRASAASPGAATVRLSPAVIAQVSSATPVSGPPALRPAIIRSATADAVSGMPGRVAGIPDAAARMPDEDRGMIGEDRWAPAAMDASALNGPPVTRQWTEDLDDSQQRARQSAARRYE
ncbi:hypothetical protein ACWEOZ_23570 [Actinoplanes sp. NPDC004185]